jgi:outer membrane protein assembly factor BamB
MRLHSWVLALCFVAVSSGAADTPSNWANWRGPTNNGVSPDGNPPTRWSETENIRFKVAIPGRSLASPVVWGDRVFVTSVVAVDLEAYAASLESAAEVLARDEWPPKVEPVKQRFLVMAFSRHDGSLLWQRTAAEQVPHEAHYIDSSWSTASPVTDGKRLIAHFGSNGTFAYDLDGQLLWQVDLGDQTTRRGFGEGSSPALYDDTVIINWDHEGDSFLVALNAADGIERWRTERPEEVTSWATPLIVENGDRRQIVIPATGRSRGYDFASGEELWSVAGMTVNTIPTAVEHNGTVFLASGYRGTMLQAVDLSRARGRLEGSEALVWTHDKNTPYVPSLLLYDGQVYFFKSYTNVLSVLDAASGEPVHSTHRVKTLGNVWASPVAAAGRVYIFDRDGTGVVLEHGPELRVLATNELDGIVDATPAIVGRDMFVRSRTHLYCISED